MDIFALGCIIAETFLDGKGIFDYESLLKYKKGEYDPEPALSKISNPNIHKLVTKLISVNSENRMSISELLQEWYSAIVDKTVYSFLFYLDSGIYSNMFVQPDLRVALI